MFRAQFEHTQSALRKIAHERIQARQGDTTGTKLFALTAQSILLALGARRMQGVFPPCEILTVPIQCRYSADTVPIQCRYSADLVFLEE